MSNYETNAEGYLLNRDDWTEEFMNESIEADGLGESSEQIGVYCMKARQMYEDEGTVPSIRVFAKSLGMDRKAKDLYTLFTTAPMKRICRYGGLPQPTGCV